jgi:hypothetical protein
VSPRVLGDDRGRRKFSLFLTAHGARALLDRSPMPAHPDRVRKNYDDETAPSDDQAPSGANQETSDDDDTETPQESGAPQRERPATDSR